MQAMVAFDLQHHAEYTDALQGHLIAQFEWLLLSFHQPAVGEGCFGNVERCAA